MKRKRSTNVLSGSKKKRHDYSDSNDEEDYDIAVAGVMKVCSVVRAVERPANLSTSLISPSLAKICQQRFTTVSPKSTEIS